MHTIRFTKARGVPIKPSATDIGPAPSVEPAPVYDADHHNDPLVEQERAPNVYPSPSPDVDPFPAPSIETLLPPGLLTQSRETVQQARGGLTLLVGAPFLTYLALNKNLPGWARVLSSVGVAWVLFGEGGLLATAKE